MKELADSIRAAMDYLDDALSAATALDLPETYKLLDDALTAADQALTSVTPE